MSGSRLGRGRGARLALYGCMLIIFVIIVYLYRAASIEMTRLHELHVQCAHQQEALAAQLQVIYEYKVRVEKSLQEEKNSNQALKQELQQRASREKSLRDKDNEEIVQRYNAMQQKYNILQSENKDLQEECDKRQKLALEETNKLEFTLRNLRNDISRAQEDKKASMESLKNKHAQLKADYDKLDSEHNNLVKNSANWKSNILHLEKEVFQLKRELEQAKKSITSADYNVINPPASQHQKEMNQDKSRAHSANEQVARPSQQQQQVSRPSNDDENPPPLPAPRDHQAIGENLNEKNDGRLPNEQISDVGFAQRDGNIVPVGPNELKDQKNNLPLPMPYKGQGDDSKKNEKGTENVGEEPPNNKPALNQGSGVLQKPVEKSSSNGPKLVPIQPQRSDKEIHSDNRGHIESPHEVDELQDLNEKVIGIFNGAH